MDERHVPSRLRYVDADQLDSRVLDLDGLDVRNHQDDHIGDVEGLLVDSTTGRPRYLVVDSGGWFKSRRFLLPVMHARLDSGRKALRVDLDKDTINRFPEMHYERFDTVSDDEWRRYDDGVVQAFGTSGTGMRQHERYDEERGTSWWNAQAWTTMTPGAPPVSTYPAAGADVVSRADRDPVLAHEVTTMPEARAVRPVEPSTRDRDRTYRDDQRDDLVTPAVGERAQPGDVLGIESRGETTSLGDTAVDEDKRRESAEEALRKERIEPDDTTRRRR